MEKVYGGTYKLPKVDDLHVGDEFPRIVRRADDGNDVAQITLIVEDIYELFPGTLDVVWVVDHQFKESRCTSEVAYDPKTGRTDVTIYVYED